MMINFLHTTLSLDTEPAKVDTEDLSEVVQESRACMASLIKVTACPHRRRMISTRPRQQIPLPLASSSSTLRPQEKERQVPACRIIIVMGRLSPRSTRNSSPVELPAVTGGCRKRSVGLRLAFPDKITDLDTNSPANTGATMMLSVASPILPRCPVVVVVPAPLPAVAPVRRSTTCRASPDCPRARTRASRATADIRALI